jgi:hypothetical protein
MFCLMKRRCTPALELALLLVLMLPLQGFASAASCAASAADQHCAHGTAAQHHGCGTCCSAAIVVTSFDWAPPQSRRPQLSVPLLFSPPKLALDRLDRPPRPAA